MQSFALVVSPDYRFSVQGLEVGFWVLGFGFWGLGFWVWGLGVWGLEFGFGVWGLEFGV